VVVVTLANVRAEQPAEKAASEFAAEGVVQRALNEAVRHCFTERFFAPDRCVAKSIAVSYAGRERPTQASEQRSLKVATAAGEPTRKSAD
jgi:hypothetical protein